MSPDERPELCGFAHLPYPLIVLNESKDIVVANAAVQKLFASSKYQFLGSNLSELPVDVISKSEWNSLDAAVDSVAQHHFKEPQSLLDDADLIPKDEISPEKDQGKSDPAWRNPDGTNSCDVNVAILKSNNEETDLLAQITVIPWASENSRYTTLAFTTLSNENSLQGFGPRTSFSYLDRLVNANKPSMESDADTMDGLEMASGPRRRDSRDQSSSEGQSQLDIEFSRFRDAIYWNSQQAGFILSADEKFCYPNYRGSKSVKPVEVDDVAALFASWDVWDSTFENKLPLSQYPSIWLNRNRKNFHRRRYGLIEPNGRKVILEADGNCLYDQENGAFIGGVVWLRELGVHPEFNLKESQEKLKSFETICDSLPHLVWTTNQKGECDYLSRGWYEFTGTTKGNSYLFDWRNYIHCDDRSDALQQFSNGITQGSEFELEFRYKRHDEEFRWMVLRARPLLDSKDVILKWYGTLSDISTRVVLERENKRLTSEEQLAQQRARVRTEFLAHMSHEIRTPIAGVVGMADLLDDDILDEEQTELVNCIRISSKLLLTVVNDILDFSQIESGELVMDDVPFIVSEVVNDTCQIIKLAAEKKGIDFGYTLNTSDLLWTKGDPARLAQILSKLLTNSIKFTPRGSVHLTVFREDTNDTSSIKFIVQDTGIGINTQAQKRLFEPFRQGDASAARLYGGTGLGLIISRNLAYLMKGTLELESTSGVGTKAILTLPFHEYSQGYENSIALDEKDTGLQNNFKDVTENPPSEIIKDAQVLPILPGTDSSQLPIQNKPFEPISKDKINLLIVEDNDINQKIAIKSVRKLGFSTTAVWNGQEALDHLYSSEGHVSAILMDIQMPILDGYETTRRLRTEEKYLQVERLRNVPIIALTASAIQGDREKCLAVGMNDYLSKPYSLKDLERVISKWIC